MEVSTSSLLSHPNETSLTKNSYGKPLSNPSPSSKNMRSVFQRIEQNHYLPAQTPGHGSTGYFQTNMARVSSIGQPALGIMQAVAQNLSLPSDSAAITARMNDDANFLDAKRDWTNGIWGLPLHAKKNGERFSSRDYIKETISQKFPLTLSVNSLATKVLFAGNVSTNCANGKPRAVGVEYMQGKSLYRADSRYVVSNKGTVKTAMARKEVILSGGTFNTPQILMLSGVGPKAHLQEMGIQVVVDSPGVGQNM